MLSEFVQQMQDSIKGVTEGMHTAIPGEIVSFDTSTCLATVKPVMKFRKPDGERIDFPNVSGVPVVFPQMMGQKASVAFPIKPGDGCLLIVAEQSIDFWQYGQETETDLHFDLSNAICMPGMFNKPNPALVDATNKDAVIVDVSGTRIAVKGGSVQIDAAQITMNGNVKVNGNFTTAGGVVNLN